MAGNSDSGERVWQEICKEDQLTHAAQANALESFLRTAGLFDRFADFALERSNMAKVPAHDLDIDGLKALGYSLRSASNGQHHWVRQTAGLEQSVFTYALEDEAWRSAYVDATANGLLG